jgi:hypothetical protein
VDKTGGRKTEREVPPMAKVRREESQRKPNDESESLQGADAARVSVGRLVPNTTRGKPAWEFWSGMPKTGVADAVALSCDIDPRQIDMNNEGRAPDLAQFWQRLQVAEANQDGHLKAEKQPYNGFQDLWKVDLEVFAAWAESLRARWELPAEFPRPKVEEQKPTVADKPLLTRERDTLLKIILGLAAAHGIPLGDPWIAAQRIEGFTKKAGRRVAARTIEEHLNKAAILPEDKD